MSRRFAVIWLLFLAIPLFGSGKKQWTQAENMGFAGRVKTVFTTQQMFRQEPPEPNGVSIFYLSSCDVCEFDREGNQVKSGVLENGYFRGGVKREIRDDLGRVQEEVWEDEKGKVTGRHLFTNGSEGKTRDDYYVDGKLLNSTTFRYDSRGNVVESTVYKPDGTVESHNETTFNNQDRPLESLTVGPGDNYSHVIQTYNSESGHYESFTRLNPDGSVRLRMRFNDDTVLSFWQQTGDKHTYGSGIGFENASGIEQDIREYNSAGTYSTIHLIFSDKTKRNPLKATRYDSDHKFVMEADYEYELDAVGNWTKRTVWVRTQESGERQLLEKDTRTLTYYSEK